MSSMLHSMDMQGHTAPSTPASLSTRWGSRAAGVLILCLDFLALFLAVRAGNNHKTKLAAGAAVVLIISYLVSTFLAWNNYRRFKNGPVPSVRNRVCLLTYIFIGFTTVIVVGGASVLIGGVRLKISNRKENFLLNIGVVACGLQAFAAIVTYICFKVMARAGSYN
ncbi:hypothetical protein DM860_014213 [Cuscuta australis]|uniref:Transmembrane protein n=1 Tax=Cuscuta australis TaxID=267555 RepID=A0A328DCX4_9ASTE|nr:hypothetical protein DM860_014213 [Cuscuta australis]